MARRRRVVGFRDPDAWEALDQLVIGPLVERSGVPHAAALGEGRAAIRVWVPACGTGEEAYWIAILLGERLRTAGRACRLQIFASDIDPDALAVARAGVYPARAVAKVSAERRQQFFVPGEGTYRIVREIRDAVVFSEQDLLGDPPFVNLDLISCRHRLTTLEPETQQRLLATFHFALREGGQLFLGGDEAIAPAAEDFERVSSPWPVYRRRGFERHRPGLLPAQLPRRPEPPLLAHAVQRPTERHAHDLASLAQELILQRYVPLCALINRQAEILYLHGSTERYLQLDGGTEGANLVACARQGLQSRLRAALDQVFQDGRRIECRGASPPSGDPERDVHVTVEPVAQSPGAEPLWLVSLVDSEAPRGPDTGGLPAAVAASIAAAAWPPPAAERTRAPARRQLEDELRETREELQCTMAELQAANDQFQSANEESLSINEQLQAANEDLDASKEELHSVNEELLVVNRQLEEKLAEFKAANDDLVNLLNSTQSPTIFLDRQLRLRRFTPAATRLLRLRPTDIGRPLSDLAPQFVDEDLLADADRVLRQLTVPEKELPTRDGAWYVRRIHPFVTEGNRVGGVVLAFADITKQKTQEALLERARERLDLAQRAAGQGSWVWDIPTGQFEWSPDMFALFGLDGARDTPSFASWEAVLHPEDRAAARERIEQALEDHCVLVNEFRVVLPDGRIRWISALGRACYDDSGNALRMTGVCMDITDRKRAEEALRASEERFRALATAGSYVVYQMSPDWTEMRQLVGKNFIADTEAPSCTWLETYIPPDDQPQVLAAIQDAIRRQAMFELEHRVIRADGTIGWTSSRAIPLLDAHGNIAEWFGAASDVTDRKNAEDAVLRAIPDRLFEIDGHRRIVGYHTPDDQPLYLPPERFLGRSIAEVLPPDAADVYLAALAEAEEKGHHRGAVYGLDFPGGRRWFELSIAAHQGRDGIERRFMVLARDITERKQAEERVQLSEAAYRTIIDSVDAMLLVHDPDTGAILDANRKFLDLMGVDLEQAQRMSVRDIASLDTTQEGFLQDCHATRKGQPLVVESSGRYKDGREFCSQVHLQLVNLGGQPRLLANVHDVTALKRASQSLAQARDAAEAANQAKSQFLANISHELRTPITGVLGMLELALRERLRPALRERLELAKHAADLELELLNELLDFARIEAGKLSLAADEFNLRSTLEQTLKVLALKAYEKGLELQYHLPRTTPVQLVGDSSRLRQILNNLVNNAIKFTETGEVVLRVAVDALTPQDVLLRFVVTDTGIGISREDQEKIFVPFMQADPSLGRRFGGTGLGLPISNSLATLMGGQLRVESKLGRGSTFTLAVRFPRLREDMPSPLEQAFLPQLRDLGVLVVDRHATGRQIVCEILSDWSLQPTAAASVAEAQAAAEQRAAVGQAFPLLIVDASTWAADERAWQGFLRRQERGGPAIVVLVPGGSPDTARHLEKLPKRAVAVEKPVSQHAFLLALLRGLNLEPRADQHANGAQHLALTVRPLRVLVADDVPIGRLFVSEALRERGHAVCTAASGREAFELVRDQPFDVVLMDVQMPDMDGYQATAAIRALPDSARARLPIVALTAHARPEDERECLAAGMNAYLAKPLATTTLIELVERVAGNAKTDA